MVDKNTPAAPAPAAPAAPVTPADVSAALTPPAGAPGAPVALVDAGAAPVTPADVSAAPAAPAAAVDGTQAPAPDPADTEAAAIADEKARASRFVIIDGVQILRERAIRRGLIKAGDEGDVFDGPPESRARTSRSARRR